MLMEINKKRVLRFLFFFIFFIVLNVLLLHFRSFRGDPPCAWTDIFEDIGSILLISLFGAAIMIFKTED